MPIASVNGAELVDVVSEEDKKETKKEVKTEVKQEVKETKKEEKVAKEETKQADKEVANLKNLTLLELKEIAKERGVKGYSKMKKEELLEVLK